MKTTNRTILFIGFAALLLLLACVSSCMLELEGGYRGKASLMVQPSVAGSQPTKVNQLVPGVDDQKENDLDSLYVFVKGVTNPAFWKTYFLTVADNNLEQAIDNLLSDNWREDVDDSGNYHYVEGDKYDVYAVANVNLTSVPTSFEALKALKENEYSSSCVWDDGTINPEYLNLHKTYRQDFDPSNASGQNRRALTTHKKFMMDGVVTDWSPVGGIQVINMDLKRAASKFEVTVSFSDSLLTAFQTQGKSVVGQPGWRFINFAFDAPVINPVNYGSATPEADHVLTAGALLLGNASYGTRQECYRFQINTYSYPHVWDLSDAVNQAPALVISVGIDDGTSTTYTYYRIPLIDQTTTTSIGRNMLYRVNALIEGSGSTSLDDLTGMIVNYEVIPWNDPQHSGTQPAPVEFNERLYLQVTPHTYTLRGDGTQTVDLTYMLPTGKHVKIQYFTTQANNEAIAKGIDVGNSGTAAYTAGSPAAWYYNKSGTYRTRFESTAIAGNVQVSINDNNANDDVNKGTITVSSNSLPNKAIKHIAFRVYLDVPNWYSKGLYRDIYIRHFPTDNIQGIAGSWSSRWNGSNTTQTVTEYTYDLSTAQGWGSYSSEEIEVSSGEPYDRTDTVTEELTGSSTRFENLVSQGLFTNADARNANSEANAVLATDGSYYWGEGTPVRVNGNQYYYDYYTGNYYNSNNCYQYPNRYKKTIKYYRTRYYRRVQVDVPSTGNWVDWDNDKVGSNGATSSRTVSYDNFKSKVYMPFNAGSYQYGYTTYRWDAGSYCVPIAQSSSSGGRYYYTYNNPISSAGSYTNLVNNYMYVIQISETNPTYKLGRPELDGNYQTNDHVVSPAFMIASQLGAVSPFGSDAAAGRNAAAHCGTYMEVAQDGKRYVGWRLPTEEEIRVIIKYQGTDASSVVIDGITITNNDDRVLTPVLTGSYYWTSNNKTAPVETGYTVNPSSDAYVRCVRDMSPEEIKALNRE